MQNALEVLDKAFETLVQRAGGNAEALFKLSELAMSRGNERRALEIALDITPLAKDRPELAMRIRDLVADKIPAFHVPMLRDHERNAAFEGALKRAITPDTRVLDVGSGTGLLAMFAARAGAKRVVSCEANIAMAGIAREIIEQNGFLDKITILAKHSNEIDCDSELGGRVDLVVSEIVGKDLVDECVLPSMMDVARRLLKPGGQMIPQRGEVRLALAWWEKLDSRMRIEQACGFDVSPLNRLLPSTCGVKRGDPSLELRSASASLFSFDFSSTEPPPLNAALELTGTAGPINGVVQWIGLKMDDEAYFENRPEPGKTSSWGCQFLPLRQVIEDGHGQVVRICGSHKDNSLCLWQE